MPQALDLEFVKSFGTALLIGALIGIEREKRKGGEGEVGMAGLRTFILVALVGAICGWLACSFGAPVVLTAGILLVAALLLAGYVLAARVNPQSLGLTTEFAVVTVFLLGAMVTLGYGEAAVALGILTAAVLAYRQPLHGLVEKLGWDDIFAGLRLLIATFIVLPLLPDRAIDPWGALNPFKLWVLVLLISGLSLVGYVATRWFGTGKGPAVAGLTGGLVSSTAVTLSFARESSDAKAAAAADALVCGILLAWSIMFIRIVVIVAVANRALAMQLLPPVAIMTAAVAVPAAFYFWRGVRGRSGKARGEQVALKNPFSLTQAARFAAIFAVILLVVKLAQHYFPGQGVYLVAAIAGTTDVDAITLSMAAYAREADPRIAVVAIVIASLSNTLVKCAMVVGLGGASVRAPILGASAALLVAGIAVIAIG